MDIENINTKYGMHCSWAVWKKININKPAKYGINDTQCIMSQSNILNRNIILVGLNPSGTGAIDGPLSNFHSSNPYAHDYKIRFSTQNTIFEGAYMTDLFKNIIETDSSKIKTDKHIIMNNIKIFKQEIGDLGSIDPIIIAFGNKCFKILHKYLSHTYNIYKITHYSAPISKENLKTEFDNISNILNM